MNCSTRILVTVLLCAPAWLFAAGGDGGGGGSKDAAVEDPVITTARASIAKQDWAAAQAGLKQALAANPRNADYHNLYAYSTRKGPNPDMDLVFKHYNEALRIDPRHRGAHEYIGEAYLQVNNLAKAKEHLAALNRICFFGCEEYSDLKKEVASYEASHKVATQ
jgi:tetratricopeptide (TPR) repeat protein